MPTVLDNSLDAFNTSLGDGLIVLLLGSMIIVAIFTALIRAFDI